MQTVIRMAKASLKQLAGFVVVLIVTMTWPGRQAEAQVCVDNAMAHMTFIRTPGTGTYGYYLPNITLPPGAYTYTYSVGSGMPIQNFHLILNGLSWTPGNVGVVGPPPNNLSFSLYVPVAVPLCTSVTIQIRFKRSLGLGASVTVCKFDLTVVSVEDGERRNLTFVSGASKAYYAGSDGKAYVLTWNGATNQWDYAALNVAGGWGAVRIDGQMASFVDGSRIFFKGKDQKLYSLSQAAGSWILAPLSQAIANIPNVSIRGNVAARNSNEVVFVGTDNKLHRLSLTGTVWADQIIVPAGGWLPGVGSPNGTSIYLSQGGTNIFFEGSGVLAQVYQLSVNGPWVVERISGANVPFEYWYEGDLLAVDDYAVYFKGKDRLIHRYTKCGGTWRLDAMPVSAASASEQNVVLNRHGGDFLTKFPDEDRVFYKAATGRIYNIYNENGIWFNYSLDNAMVNAAGDLIAAEGKIFYINHDKRVHNLYWNGNTWADVALSPLPQADTKSCIMPYY